MYPSPESCLLTKEPPPTFFKCSGCPSLPPYLYFCERREIKTITAAGGNAGGVKRKTTAEGRRYLEGGHDGLDGRQEGATLRRCSASLLLSLAWNFIVSGRRNLTSNRVHKETFSTANQSRWCRRYANKQSRLYREHVSVTKSQS